MNDKNIKEFQNSSPMNNALAKLQFTLFSGPKDMNFYPAFCQNYKIKREKLEGCVKLNVLVKGKSGLLGQSSFGTEFIFYAKHSRLKVFNLFFIL